jgi:hypothetical protein
MTGTEDRRAAVSAATDVHTSRLDMPRDATSVLSPLVFGQEEKDAYLDWLKDTRLLSHFLPHADWWDRSAPRKITQAEIDLVAGEISDVTEREDFKKKVTRLQEDCAAEEARLGKLSTLERAAMLAAGMGEPIEKKVNPLSTNRLMTGLTYLQLAAGFGLYDYTNPFAKRAEAIVGQKTLTQARLSQAFYYEKTLDGKYFKFTKPRGMGETVHIEPPTREITKKLLGEDNYRSIAYAAFELSAVLAKKKRLGRNYPNDDFPPEVLTTESEAKAAKAMSELAELIFSNIPLMSQDRIFLKSL